MKKVQVILIFVIVLFGETDKVFAQSDSIKVEYRQESSDSSTYAKKFRYKYLDIKLKEEKNLIKIGTRPLSIELKNYSFRINTCISFEKKILPEWSIIIDNEFTYDQFGIKQFSNSINIGTRYYYGMNKAIKKKISGNNFNRNYLELSVRGLPSIDNTLRERSDGTFYHPNSNRLLFFTAAGVSWGIQRRFNDYSYFDTKISAGYSFKPNAYVEKQYVYVGVSFVIGFGFNIKR